MKDNIWGAAFEDKQLISKCNKGFRFLLCAINIFSKNARITNAFQNTLIESRRNRNKTWVDKCSEFYSRSTKSWLQDNDTKLYSTHNEGKSVVAKRFIRTLKNKNCKYKT